MATIFPLFTSFLNFSETSAYRSELFMVWLLFQHPSVRPGIRSSLLTLKHHSKWIVTLNRLIPLAEVILVASSLLLLLFYPIVKYLCFPAQSSLLSSALSWQAPVHPLSLNFVFPFSRNCFRLSYHLACFFKTDAKKISFLFIIRYFLCF